MKYRLCLERYRCAVWVAGFLLITIGGTMLSAQSGERRIQFSNIEWIVRRSQGKQGPGPNFFKDWEDSVSLGEAGGGSEVPSGKDSSTEIGEQEFGDPLGSGELTLRAAEHPIRNQWFSSEILTKEPVGYGTFQITLRIAEPGLDSNLIFGFFTYDQNPAQNHSEIDIEFGFFGDKTGSWIHTSVQPSDSPTNTKAVSPPRRWGTFSLEFIWKPEQVFFRVIRQKSEELPPWEFEHSITGAQVPVPFLPHLHTNLWFFQGEFPEDDGNLEIVIEDIDYRPLY